MEIKMFEIRDRATCIPALAVNLGGEDVSITENWLLAKAGFGLLPQYRDSYVILFHLERGEGNYDPYKWADTRTMMEAHKYIIDKWADIKSGDVVDVEYILGESAQPKETERNIRWE